jgi:DDE superfamily endonuclease
MDITLSQKQLKQFRLELYQNFNKRADTLLELVDALCSSPTAESVVELSQSGCFRRSYSSLFKAIEVWRPEKMLLPQLLRPSVPEPQQWPFWLLLVDVSPQPRPYGETVADRGMVYEPTVIKGNKPVTIGHQYSTVALGLEPEFGVSSSWVLPLLSQRVTTSENKEMVGASQVDALLQDPQLPFGQALCVEAVDSSYSQATYLHAHRRHPNLVTIARLKSNRTLYHQAEPPLPELKKPGHPTWYGPAFRLSTSENTAAPDESLSFWETSRRGKRYRVEIQAWHNMLMRGHCRPQPLPMHQYPFTLVCITRYDATGKPLYQRPLWLLVMGERRAELSLIQIYQAYTTRFDLEHFFRFGKQKLLMSQFQTPEVVREEKWWLLTHIAYAQLWLARPVTLTLPRPWERNLPAMKSRLISPSLVQRDFARIIRQLGTPAQPPKPRNITSGRPRGATLPKRPRQPVVIKGKCPSIST